MTRDDLQIVVLEDLKDHWDDQDVRNLYCDTMKLKFEGYGNVYGDNVISSDKVDYFGTHLIVCQKGIRLKPLFAYKSVTLEKCEEYLYQFPCLSLIQSDGEKECFDELTKIVDNAKSSNRSVSFDYSWAQDVSLKNVRSPGMAQMFRDLVMVLVVNHHKDYNIDEMITCGVVKVKTDQFFDKMGFNKISKKSMFAQKDLNGDDVHIFHTSKYSEHAMNLAKDYQDLWDNRIEFSNSKRKSSHLKIAA